MLASGLCSECGVRCRAENREDAQGPRPQTARCLPLAELHRLCAWNPSDLTSLLGDKGRVTQLSAGGGEAGGTGKRGSKAAAPCKEP